jgi:hypothetical protein
VVTVIGLLKLVGGKVPERLQQVARVVPRDPLERSLLAGQHHFRAEPARGHRDPRARPHLRRSERRVLVLGFEVADHSLGLDIGDGDDLVGVLFRGVKSQPADREIDDFMTVPDSRPA